jgi:hypothetical protein
MRMASVIIERQSGLVRSPTAQPFTPVVGRECTGKLEWALTAGIGRLVSSAMLGAATCERNVVCIVVPLPARELRDRHFVDGDLFQTFIDPTRCVPSRCLR